MTDPAGPGGTEKTRLALEAATAVPCGPADQHFAGLAPRRDVDPALAVLARAIGLREGSGRAMPAPATTGSPA